LADFVAKVADVAGDDLDCAWVIEVEGGIWPCSALSRQFNRLCTDTFPHWIGWLALIQGTGNSQWRRPGDMSGQFLQVLGSGREQELVLRPAWST